MSAPLSLGQIADQRESLYQIYNIPPGDDATRFTILIQTLNQRGLVRQVDVPVITNPSFPQYVPIIVSPQGPQYFQQQDTSGLLAAGGLGLLLGSMLGRPYVGPIYGGPVWGRPVRIQPHWGGGRRW